MRFFSILSTALLLPVMTEAKVYDLADIKTGDIVSFCPTEIEIQQSVGYDKAYYCHGEISLKQDVQIISSKDTYVQLRAFTGLNLKGRNTIGSPDNRIDIKSLSQGVIINNTNHETDYTFIYGDIKTDYAVSLENVLIDGDVDSRGMTVELKGLYNVVRGQVTASQNLKLENTQVCGDVWSSGGLVEIGANKNIIVGGLFSLQDLTLSNTDVFGAIESKGANITLNKTSVYAKHKAIKAFHTASFVDGIGQVCGTIEAHRINNDITQFCAKDDPDCTYATNNCPEKEIPFCELVPPTDDDFDLVVTPAEDMALMCGDELPQFTVTTTSNGEMTSAHVLASLSDPNLFTLEMVEGKQKIDDSNFISKDDGTLIVKVVPNNIDTIALDANYTITFTMVDDTNKMQTVQFMLTPYMFEAYADDMSSLDEIHVVAGKSKTVKTRLLACAATGEQIIATNYDGTPQVTHPLIKPVGGSEGNFSYSAEFKDGLSSHGLITNESGLFSVRLSDTFECTGFQECPDEGSVKVEGTFNVKSRPWTLAICDGSTALASGTSESGPGFIAAGEHFSLTVKPIVWQNAGSLSGEVNTTSYCSADVTQNFMLEDAPAASIVLSSKQKTPTETATQTKKLLESTLSLTRSHIESENSQYTFSGLYWEEVGSLKIKANLDSQYLNMTVNTGYRNVGRFYAKYFKAREAKWTYPTKQDFIYMNQPFERVSYDVVALNAKKEDIQNYVYFNASLREHFHLGELSNYVNRFIPPAANSVEWNLVGNASVGSFTIEKATGNPNCDNSPCWEKDATDGKYPDGPFNKDSSSTKSEIGLAFVEEVDEIHFFDDRHILEQQPDIRFGRLNFKDVGGNQGMTIKVPLDVEVWQNGRFVTHFEDSATKTNGKHHTRTPIWSNSAPNNTLLSGEGSIIAGRTYGIVASQVDSAREQVRFHLDLSSAGNNLPWLKYNWDKSDADEDNPPTVVTFGIHRGNDRIIYRGEPNFY